VKHAEHRSEGDSVGGDRGPTPVRARTVCGQSICEQHYDEPSEEGDRDDCLLIDERPEIIEVTDMQRSG